MEYFKIKIVLDREEIENLPKSFTDKGDGFFEIKIDFPLDKGLVLRDDILQISNHYLLHKTLEKMLNFPCWINEHSYVTGYSVKEGMIKKFSHVSLRNVEWDDFKIFKRKVVIANIKK